MLNNDLTKYLTMNPQAFSYTLLGLSTLILAYFVGEETVEPDKAQESVVKESKPEEDADDIDIEELINKKFSSTEQRGGKKSKKHKTKRRKYSRL
jgi:hypothetical protein